MEINQRKLPRLPWQHANSSAPCSAHPECQLWQTSSDMHIDVLQARNPDRNVGSEMRVISSGRWNVLSAHGDEGSPVLAYRSTPPATRNHCICSPQWHETCPTHKEKHMLPSQSGACFSCLLCCANTRGKFLCYHCLTGSVLLIEQRSAAPDSGWCCRSAWEATVGQLMYCRSDQQLFFMLKQHMWRADIGPSFIWWLVQAASYF